MPSLPCILVSDLACNGNIRRRSRIRRRPSRAAELDHRRNFDSLGRAPRDPSLDCPGRRDLHIDRDPCPDRDIRCGRPAAFLDQRRGRPGPCGRRRLGPCASRDPSPARRPSIGSGRFVDLVVAGHSGQLARVEQ
jgi:hypothetical protein